MAEKIISKRIPSDTNMDTLTFLNDKKINGNLYGFLQSISVVYKGPKEDTNEKITVVYKNNMPTQSEIIKQLKLDCTTRTLRNHLAYLVDRGFLKLSTLPGVLYELPVVEDFYYLIPVSTLQYLTNNCKPHIVKLYTYLGTKFQYCTKYNQECLFNANELGTHIGLGVKNHSEGYAIINNALTLLYNSGLIDYIQFYDKGHLICRLTNVSLHYRKKPSPEKNNSALLDIVSSRKFSIAWSI